MKITSKHRIIITWVLLIAAWSLFLENHFKPFRSVEVGQVWTDNSLNDGNPFAAPPDRPILTVINIKDGWVQYNDSRFQNINPIELEIRKFKRWYDPIDSLNQ